MGRCRRIAAARKTVVLAAAATIVAAVLASAPAAAQDDARLRLQAVDVEQAPQVTLSLVMPVSLFDPSGPMPDFEVEENGRKVSVLESRPAFDRGPLDIVLVIDTSGSMRGAPIEDAKKAAGRFLQALDPSDEVAIIAFDSRPDLAAGFSNDRSHLDSALDGMRAEGETAVYDAVVAAGDHLASRAISNRSIVLLSDGGDTVSSGTLDEAIRSVQAAAAPVYVVGLESPEFDPGTLESLSEASGGRLVKVDDSAALADEFTAIAEEIQNLYQVTFESRSPATADLELDVRATAARGTATLATVIDNPAHGISRAIDVEAYRIAVQADPMLLTGAAIVAFAAVALLASSTMLLLARGRSTLSQLRYYDQGTERTSDATAAQSGFRTRILEAIGVVAAQRGLAEGIREKLERAGLPLRPLEYIYAHMLVVIGVGVVTEILTGSLFASMLMVLFAVVLPLFALEIAIERRRRAFEEQLPEILGLIAGSIRSGWGLLQSLDLVVQEIGDPARSEFRRVQSAARLGLPLERALEHMAERTGSLDFHWTVVAIGIQRDVGGNLAEVLDILAETMRERAALRRHVRALTAEGRLSAVILYILPFVAMLSLSVVNPDHFQGMLQHPLGLGMLAAGAVLLVFGGFWLSRVTKVEV